MIPSLKQYSKWSLPSKWGFWSALTGIPTGIISLLLVFWPPRNEQEVRELKNLMFQTAQDLRGNREYLCALYASFAKEMKAYPIAGLRAEAVVELMRREYEMVVESAYGEEKYVYQLAEQFRDIGKALGRPRSAGEARTFLESSEMTLHDIAFLNDFLHWYLRPLIEEHLSERQLYSLGWSGFPGEKFRPCGAGNLEMKCFLHDGQPIDEFGTYLGLID